MNYMNCSQLTHLLYISSYFFVNSQLKKTSSQMRNYPFNWVNQKLNSFSLDTDHHQPQSSNSDTVPPIVSFYNETIRPILDAVENLRRLNITKEGIQLPSIVVVGDQSSGKSSVLESLAGIRLPRGQGICTRVPLIMRLQSHSVPETELVLEYNNITVLTDEEHVSDAINTATEELAGKSKGICNSPLTLVVKKDGVPDLTMVDLPGITRVPVHGQPEDIYDQVKDIIMEYIKPEETIILNVLSATVDFPTCESIRMSQSVDRTGLRTLAVVTKADKAPEGLKEKVTADDVNIGLGYICVRNRINDESYEDARKEEAMLFQNHPLLSKIDKSMVGVPVLAQRLVRLQASIISKTLPEMLRKINEKLNSQLSELESLPKNLTCAADAMAAFMHIIGLVKESLKKILIRGEFDEYPEDKSMHCTARLVEKLNEYSKDLHECPGSNHTENFLMDEIMLLEEAKGIGLPNFMPRTAFLALLKRKVGAISSRPIQFIDDVWDYLGKVVIGVINRHSEHYYQLQRCTCRAGENLIFRMRENSKKHVKEAIEMEKLTDYTCKPEYMTEYYNLMAYQAHFVATVREGICGAINISCVGENIQIRHLGDYIQVLDQAYDLKMRMVSYWKIVLRRLIDTIALHLQFSINSLVNNELEKEITACFTSPSFGGIESLLEESPSMAAKRAMLSRSVEVLKESKEVVSNIMDGISSD
ncbi:dynamin-related protein 4C-like [Neltuma alba]|uniref:dynamin-related protein 4C-like n=1 Tax=Neltuma alba TaxID=207710 RepID=UPI0010A2A9E7|nr:dynamin-related protein 4C-like [Prosopis alba]